MALVRAAAVTMLVAVGLLTAAVSGAGAQDLTAKLSSAEDRVSASAGKVAVRQQQLAAAERRYRAAARRAKPVEQELTQARADLQQLQENLTAQERQADAQISQLEKQRQQETDDRDEEVRNGLGFGLAALVAGLIAVAWGWFRATDAVAALTKINLGQAIGLCVGGGLLTVILGAALGSSDGAAGALGSFIFCLGLILPTALLLARHSAEVQRGRSKPLLRRERLPGWVSIATAGLMSVLFLASTGSAIFADDAGSQPVPAQLREEAEAASEGQGAEELEAAKERVIETKQQTAPLAQQSAAQQALVEARRGLGSAKRQLANAKSSQRSIVRRLASLEARERQEAEREAALIAREEEEQAEQAEEELASECHPSYSPCLDPYSPDYDCENGSGDGPDYTSTVEVIGPDVYGLDDDGDGIGCDLG